MRRFDVHTDAFTTDCRSLEKINAYSVVAPTTFLQTAECRLPLTVKPVFSCLYFANFASVSSSRK